MTAGANNCPVETLKQYGFASTEALLAARQAGERPDAVKHCLIEGQRVCGAPPPRSPSTTRSSLSPNPTPSPSPSPSPSPRP